MKSVLLIGLGRFGRHVAMRLYDLNYQVLAVDSNEERVEQVLPYVTSAKIGDSTNASFLKSLGVSNYDCCIVGIGDEFQNSLETASLLNDLGAKKVIARACTGVQEKFLLKNGADEVVYPEKQLAAWTAVRCASDHVLDYIELDDEYSIFEINIPESWDKKSISQLNIRNRYGINILGIRENKKLNMNILPGTILEKGKSVLVLGQEKLIQKCFKL